MVLTYLIALFATALLTEAGVVPLSPVPAIHTDHYDPHPQYSYAYNVHDAITGDAKSQHETRTGDIVTGSYSLIEADGSRRVVEYTADPTNGFNAIVHREPAVIGAAHVVPEVPKISSTYVANPTFAYHH